MTYNPVKISINSDCAKDLAPFDLPLSCINISTSVWGKDCETVKGFVKHCKRVDAVDLSYPVIMDDDGFIMDGWHRVAKALRDGRATIKAVRFDETPAPDYYEDGK